MKHTELPWVMTTEIHEEFGAIGSAHVWAAGDEKKGSGRISIATIHYNKKNNADFIVKAVNNHAELVELLTLALPSIEESEIFNKPNKKTLSKRVREILERVDK